MVHSGLQANLAALGKTILTPTLDAHTHTPQLSFLPRSPPDEILLLEEATGSFIASLWATRIKEQNGCFPLRTGTEQKEGNDFSNTSMF